MPTIRFKAIFNHFDTCTFCVRLSLFASTNIGNIQNRNRQEKQFIQQFPSDNFHTSVVRVALRVHDFQSRAVSPMFMVYWPKTKSKKKYKTATTHFPKQPLTLNYLV